MPGDTSFFVINGDTTCFLTDSQGKRVFIGENEASKSVITGEQPKPGPDDGAFKGSVFVVGLILIIFGGRVLLARVLKAYRVKLSKGAYDSNFGWYYKELSIYNTYFRSLPGPQQEKFVQRTVSFMFNKRFTYEGIEADDRMPLLISAAAVQITFGLNKYHLDYFKDIFVYREDYQHGLYNQPFMGHVSADGIHLSWNNFMKGYENYSDAENVGIHEMAHALTYDNFMSGELGGDAGFKERFADFSRIARPLFNQMRQGKVGLLNSYAATNYHEFWAVAVETFFEKPVEMKAELGELYAAMCWLLNQDPLQPNKILNNALLTSRKAFR
jgi:MtfA peptidase